MKVLFITYRLPHENVAGGNRIVFQRIRHLAQKGHEVGLISYEEKSVEEEHQTLLPYLCEFKSIPAPHRNIFVRIFHDYVAFSRPALIWKRYSKNMLKTVAETVENGRYDIVVSEFSEMGQFLHKNPYLSAVHSVISCHRCMTASYEKYRDTKEVNLRSYLKSIPQLRGLRRYEFDMYRSADRILVLTPQDRFTMQYYAPDLAVSVSSTGVDIEKLKCAPEVKRDPIILMTGYMKDPANEDGAVWFAHHVWPTIREKYPHVNYYIVGANPGYRVKKLAKKDSRIVVTGRVKDLTSYCQRAKVFVSPMRLGSGLRPKVLEAMASGIPVISTSLGMAGIQAQTGVNCLVADTPELFTQSVEWLLTDPALRNQMAHNAQELVQQKHSLENGLNQFEDILKSITKG
jgi:glycosyltransferase involved in cell wall biosynthesis